MFWRLYYDHELLLVFCPETGGLCAHLTSEHSDHFFFKIIFWGIFFLVLYPTLLHLPLDLIRTRIDLIRTRVDLIRTVIIGQEIIR
jgi:hypothetical protein